ncbi:hypothetical protein HA466_0121880 [Hirschfeldia incana]|nr:hypothetical protein HA466_0121880 [Hirschfeldia incana]
MRRILAGHSTTSAVVVIVEESHDVRSGIVINTRRLKIQRRRGKSGKREKLSEMEQQLKMAEAAQRRNVQVEKAARETERPLKTIAKRSGDVYIPLGVSVLLSTRKSC